MEETMKIVNSLEESGLLIKGISEIIKNEAKEQKSGFLQILLGIFAEGEGEGTVRTGQHF